MALHTVARCDAEVPTEGYRTRPLRGVLWRPANYRFTAFDFACYEAARRYFIQEPGIARAAFLMGGIIWRLAYDAQYPHVVLFGPDIERLALTKEYRVEIGGKTYVDDLLNGDELALIGGEYRQKILHRDQTCGLSWWPSYSVWRRSALDVAFWSPIAENWYQGMVSRYRAGDAKPRNSKDWARYLVGWDKRALNTSRRVVQAAEEIIELSGAR